MASNINPTNINILYPVAGQDNDTQGFRTNFSNILSNFSVAKTEITALQAVVDNAPSIIAAVPVSPTSPGTAGEIAYNASHLYVCVAENTWRRTGLSTWS